MIRASNNRGFFMFDYEAIAALAKVIETQNFQKAAEKLFITQSAISQRIKSLENVYGEPILIRTLPYRATALGLVLLSHYERVSLLESSVKEELDLQTVHHPFSVALSRDSLATWFVAVIDQLDNLAGSLMLKIIADDQEVTLNYFKNGQVSACASGSSKALPGCKTEFLGYLDYILVASPSFYAKFFENTDPLIAFETAPAIIYDHQDNLHAQYLAKFFNFSTINFPYHTIPSVAGFKQFACKGYAYALIPKLDVVHELQNKQLVQLFPDKVWEMPVYWHSWALEMKNYRVMNEVIIRSARSQLRQ